MGATFKSLRGRQLLLGVLFVLAACLVPVAAQAQEASIIGQVTDDTGAVLPGVTVTATSPALQVKQVVDVTNERGEYRLTPAAARHLHRRVPARRISRPCRRADLRITAGFTAKSGRRAQGEHARGDDHRFRRGAARGRDLDDRRPRS